MFCKIFLIYESIKTIFYTFLLHLDSKRISYKSKVEFPAKIINPKHISIGNGTRICRYAFIAPIVKYLDQHFSPQIEILEDCYIGHSVHIVCTKKIKIGKNCLIADRVFIADNIHGHKDINRSIIENNLIEKGEVHIGNGVWIGENACIFGNLTVGEGAIIGANSVVTKSIEPYSINVGIPSRKIGSRFPTNNNH